LRIPGFEKCLEQFTPVGGSHSEHCLPRGKPINCAQQAWEGLKNVFEGDCSVVSQTGGHIGGVGAPAYLSIHGFEQCLEEFTPVGNQHSEYCLPHRRPYNCADQSWEGLQNVFEGDCPVVSISGQRPLIGGVGAPAYLSIPGFEQCLEEFTPVGGQHSQNCLPHRRPYNCTEEAWEGLQNVFEGDCPRDPCLSTRPAEGACEPYLDRWTFDQGDIFQPISGRQKTPKFVNIFP
jgi:hypothetical protein